MSESVFYRFPNNEVLELKYFDYSVPIYFDYTTPPENQTNIEGRVIYYKSGVDSWIPVGSTDNMMRLFQIIKEFDSIREFIHWNNQQIDTI